MAFVQAYSFDAGQGAQGDGTLAFSVPVSPGDFLVAVLATDDLYRESGAASLADVAFPAGWVVRWMEGAVASGDPRRKRAVAAVATFAATAAGTVAGTVRWPLWIAYPLDREMVVLRYSGIKAVEGLVAGALNSQRAAYPAVEGVASGHVVRVCDAVVSSWSSPSWTDVVPSGHTQRAMLSTGMYGSMVAVSDATVAGGPVAAATGAGGLLVSGWGVSLYLATTYGPAAPRVTSPASAADLAAAHTIAWVPDGVQTAYAVRRREYSSGVAGAWQWWSGSAWGASEVYLSGSVTSLAQAAGLWSADGSVYDVQVSTKGGADRPDGSPYGGVQVTSRQAPTASGVAVTPRTGSVVSSRVPTVAVSGTAGSGATVTGAEVQVRDPGTLAVLASGTHGPGGSWVVPVASALPNGAPVLVRGRILQTGDQPSPWLEVGPYTVTVPTPPAPAVTATLVQHPVSGLPGVRLTIVTTGGVAARIWRDGTYLGEWASPGTVAWEDYTIPPDRGIVYDVAAVDAATPVNASSPTSVTVTLPGDGEHGHCWMLDLMDPSTAVQAHLADVGADALDLRASVYEPLGQAGRIVRPSVASEMSGSLTVECPGPDELEKVLALLRSGRRLIYRSAPETHLRTRDLHPGLLLGFRPVGQVQVSRPHPGPWTTRHVMFDWIAQ